MLLSCAFILAAVAFAHVLAVWSPTPRTAGVIFTLMISFFVLSAGFLRYVDPPPLVKCRIHLTTTFFCQICFRHSRLFYLGLLGEFFSLVSVRRPVLIILLNFGYCSEPVAINQFSGQTYHCSAGEALPVPIVLANGTQVVKDFCPIQSGALVLALIGAKPVLKWPGLAVLFGAQSACVWQTVVSLFSLSLSGMTALFICVMLLGLRFRKVIRR